MMDGPSDYGGIMQFFTGLEQWGRERALNAFSRVIPTQEISAREAGKVLGQSTTARILLIGIYPKMGQFLCATPLIRSLSTAWPRASLHFLGNPANAAAARANPHLDRVWIWRKSGLWEWGGQLWLLRKEQFDLALLLSTERPSATGIFIARAIGARWVAAYVSPDPGAEARAAASLCHIRIPFGGEKNEVAKFLGFARAFGVPPQGLRPELVPSPADEAAADSFFSSQNLPAKGSLVGLFIGGKAERSDRLWPVSHFARLADSLKGAGLQVIVLSPPPPAGVPSRAFLSEEHLRLEEFRRAMSWTCPVFQEASLGRVAAFLRRLDLLVCPDGGILHLAAAVGTPTLGLFFSTDPEVWRHDLRQTFLDGRGRLSSEMRPETVANEVFRFLGVLARP
jgi:ADP-heptose:LPS heptosyltransferase